MAKALCGPEQQHTTASPSDQARPAGLEPATSGLEIGRRIRPKLNVAMGLWLRIRVAVLLVVLYYFPLNASNFRSLHRNALYRKNVCRISMPFLS